MDLTLLSQRNLKTYNSLKSCGIHQKTELINNFDKTFCEHHKYTTIGRIFSKMIHQVDYFPWKIVKEPQTDWTLFLRKHHSGVVSNLEHFPQMQQNENKIAYDCKPNENLNAQQISFPMSKTIRKVTANNFSIHSHLPIFKCEFFYFLRWQK